MKKPPRGGLIHTSSPVSATYFFLIGNQTGLGYLQIVVSRKADDKVPRHGFVRVQITVHHNAFDAIHGGGNAPGRVAQMAAALGAARAKLAHHTRQAFGPVAGTKGFSVQGLALDEQFFGAWENHQGKSG